MDEIILNDQTVLLATKYEDEKILMEISTHSTTDQLIEFFIRFLRAKGHCEPAEELIERVNTNAKS